MRLFAIPPELPFLDALATGVLAQAADASTAGDAPEALSRTTILLPTRRAARALRDAFLRQAGRTLLLPRLRALAGLSTEDADELALPPLLELPPAVAPLARQAALAAMVGRLPRRHGGPATPEQAWLLAGELGRLLDEIALEERDVALLAGTDPQALAEHWLARLEALVPERLSQHWQITTTLLRAVVTDWNAWLRARELLDIGVRRVKALQLQAALWQREPPADPIVAAGIGTGGTIPAAVALLGVIARLPRGAVLLQAMPGVEDAALRAAMLEAPTHPFCGQLRLLRALGADVAELRPWPGEVAASAPAARAALLAQAMRPAEGVEAWTEREPERWRAGLGGLVRLAAGDALQEARAIALELREALEDPGARAALVTPDRDLARRVSAELARHGITVDDSAGEPLGETPAGAFLRLIARMVAEHFAPVPLLAVLKHPLCAGGMERGAWLAALRRLERRALRGARPAPGLAGLRAALGEAPSPGVLALLDALEAAAAPMVRDAGVALPASGLLEAHLRAAEALAATNTLAGGLRLYAGEEGELLAQHLAALGEALEEMPPVAPDYWPALFDAMLAGPVAPSFRAVRRGGAPHPRVAILGLLEARLQSFDKVVLGALEESIWPQATDPGPWMSRPMRAQFGLPEPEARIGSVAADFLFTACAAPEAVLSSAAKRGGAPSVPARWLVRLDTFLAGQGELRLALSPKPDWAAALDAPAAVTPMARPAPCPPAGARPASISISDVGLLIADPYAFYAKRILRLRKLDAIDEDVGAQDYGVLVHDVLRRFLAAMGTGWAGEAIARAHWDKACAAALDGYRQRPGILAFWAPRLANIGDFIIAEERELREQGGLAACLPEIEAKLAIPCRGGAVELVARADRLDRLADGGWRILDYKTGVVPGEKELAAGSAPQLPIEAMLVETGAFPGVPAGSRVAALIYWRLTGGDQPGEVKDLPLAAPDGTPYAELAYDRLLALAESYLLGMRPFPSRPHPDRAAPGGDYDHLARIAEWSAGRDAP